MVVERVGRRVVSNCAFCGECVGLRRRPAAPGSHPFEGAPNLPRRAAPVATPRCATPLGALTGGPCTRAAPRGRQRQAPLRPRARTADPPSAGPIYEGFFARGRCAHSAGADGGGVRAAAEPPRPVAIFPPLPPSPPLPFALSAPPSPSFLRHRRRQLSRVQVTGEPRRKSPHVESLSITEGTCTDRPVAVFHRIGIYVGRTERAEARSCVGRPDSRSTRRHRGPRRAAPAS